MGKSLELDGGSLFEHVDVIRGVARRHTGAGLDDYEMVPAYEMRFVSGNHTTVVVVSQEAIAGHFA